MSNEDVNVDGFLSLDDWPTNSSMELGNFTAPSEAEQGNDLTNEPLLLSPNHNKKLSPRRRSGSSSGSSKRKLRQPAVPLNSPKRSRRTFTGNSASLQNVEPQKKAEDLKKLIEENSVEHVLKIYKDRIARRKKKGDEEFWRGFMWLLQYLVDTKKYELLKETIDSHSKIRERWQSDLQKNLDRIQEIRQQGKSGPADVMTTETLLEIGTDIERPNEQVLEFFENLKSLDNIFETQQGVSFETQREKVFSSFPLLSDGEISTNEPIADQVQGNLQQQLSSSIPPLLSREIATYGPTDNEVQRSLQTREHDNDMPSTLKECVEKLFAKDNNKMEHSHFQKEMENKNDLEPIVNRIKQERGKDTEYEYYNIQLLVCAAFKQMEDLEVEDLKWDILLKWGAVLNRAKEIGFEVKFVLSLLEKKLARYFLCRG